MVLQQKIPIIPNPLIASYNYTNIADGTGVSIFYLCQTKDFAALDQILTQNVIQSANGQITASQSDAGYTKGIDADFDLTTFNLPRTIKGTAILNMGFDLRNDDNVDGNSVLGHVYARIRKWDGTTETEIVGLSGNELSLGFGFGDSAFYTNIPLVIPTTNFKRGETLRLTIETWSSSNSTSKSRSTYIGCDPASVNTTKFTTASNIPSQSVLYIPFRIDIS